jgi:uncharacterized protein (TIGR04551 family)
MISKAFRVVVPGLTICCLGAMAGLTARSALAQPGPLPTGGPPSGEEEPKPEGIAEAAPKAAGLLATTPTLPPPRDRRKKFEVITIDGYLRVRGDYLKNLHLNFDSTGPGGAPFPNPINCSGPMGSGCDTTLRSSNLRLRLEPSIQLSETIAVHTQIDLLDNVLLGQPPASSSEGGNDIAMRRGWAEVATGLGHLKFGRMPDHFGLGIASNSGRRLDTDYAAWETLWQPSTLANVGGTNPVGYDLDADTGDTVDRLSFTAMIPGTPFRALAAINWWGTVNSSSDIGITSSQPWDADDNDDLKGWTLGVARFDAPADFADKVARGKLAMNYGVRVDRFTQDRSYDESITTSPGDAYIVRGLKSYRPDLWFKLGTGSILFEAEVAGEVGSIENLTDQGFDGKIDIRSWGAVGRVSAKALENKFGFGLEVGAASGDESDNVVQGETHMRGFQSLSGQDRSINRFIFDPNYKVDLILFRELIGTVSNALYFRPWMSYELTNSITFRAQNVTAAALRPVSTPGNSAMWGIELDGDLSYSSNGFQAGLAYGMFLPLAAMNHPEDTMGSGGTGFDYGDNAGDAGNAHTIQARFAVEF